MSVSHSWTDIFLLAAVQYSSTGLHVRHKYIRQNIINLEQQYCQAFCKMRCILQQQCRAMVCLATILYLEVTQLDLLSTASYSGLCFFTSTTIAVQLCPKKFAHGFSAQTTTVKPIHCHFCCWLVPLFLIWQQFWKTLTFLKTSLLNCVCAFYSLPPPPHSSISSTVCTS